MKKNHVSEVGGEKQPPKQITNRTETIHDLAFRYYFYKLPTETSFSNKIAARVISKIILIVFFLMNPFQIY